MVTGLVARRGSRGCAAALIVAIALALFAALEAGLRIYKKVDPSFLIMPDDTYMRYRGRPRSPEFNGFRLNSRGYKDREFDTEKKPGVYRIIGIGDSTVYGPVPYAQCYMTLLGEKVRRARMECEMLNLGVPAAGPVDYLSMFINEGLPLGPDMVLVHLYVGDDFHNGGKRFKLYSYSAAATWFNALLANWKGHEGRVFGSGTYREDRPLRSEESYVQYLADIQSGSFLKGNPSFKDNFTSSLAFISEIKRICDLRKIGFAAVICPSDVQIYPALRQKLARRLHKHVGDFDFRLPNRMLAVEFCRLGIKHLDLLDFFYSAFKKDGRNFYKPNDPHLNVRGNRFAAEQVGPWLLRHIDLQQPGGQKR